MQKIQRKVETNLKESFRIMRMGINDTGVFSIICQDAEFKKINEYYEIIFNFDKEETKRIKEFLKI